MVAREGGGKRLGGEISSEMSAGSPTHEMRESAPFVAVIENAEGLWIAARLSEQRLVREILKRLRACHTQYLPFRDNSPRSTMY